ncbi:acetyltransferase (GNAT) family protein [Pontibacter ummariensis]|uniref:Acetyltransferase (GNAT) domain-containing protein n=1 Tax=Pontibacter ummariensis TaxID=1610492 RepID=A0A239BUY7_9BACT|nr:GNAT family N-acetyltransferase [Pontibacter ummariensis]PRY15599.1 acetyltransferase (GNAT) family protein [Pontibacter ummariensis]SNS11837.1 Acetyltransferase (GNAT) domain-containing protein [Pontibacter ummariensis]
MAANNNISYDSYTPYQQEGLNKEEVIDFLYNSLDEYGDAREDIAKCIDYALSKAEGKGGSVLVAREQNRVVGALILNNTGMSGYIPENILVYVAVHNSQRGKGVGKKLVQLAAGQTSGSIALHVEPHNPARHLYEKLGFTNKYLEYRLQR